MNCGNCGSRIAGAERFCLNCGEALPEAGASPPVSLEGMGLHILSGPGVGRSFSLEEVTRIGRDVDNEARIFDPEVSRQHAVIYRYEQGYALNDLGSANGTWVNGKRVAEAVWIRAGDAIRLGTVEMQVTAPGVPLVRRAARAPSRDVSAESAGSPAGSFQAWLLWAMFGFGMLLAAAGVIGLIVVLGR
jgi:hypothetical protein